MKVILLLSALFFIVTPAAAMWDLFDIFNETAYNGSFDIITEYREPNKNVQAHQHIRGWIDIVGFDQTVNLNETAYYNKFNPVVEYDIWARLNHGTFDSITVTGQREKLIVNIATVEIDIHLEWHYTITSALGVSRTVYVDEYATFSDSTETPKQYPDMNYTGVSIIIYNNSFNPHVDVYVQVINTTTKTVYTYGGETITRRTLSGIAAVGAVNFSECLYWEDDSDVWGYKNDIAILRNMNESEFDLSKLMITVHNPYEIQQLNDLNLSTVEFDSNKPFNSPVVLVTFALLGVFGWGVKKCFSVWGDLI